MKDEEAEANAIVTFTIDDIEQTKEDPLNKRITVSEIMEVPGHVNIANFMDEDGNSFQCDYQST